MDVVRFKGGIGNQIFQYAFYQNLLQRGRDVYADIDYFTQFSSKGSFINRKFLLKDAFPDIDLKIDNSRYRKNAELVQETRFFELDEAIFANKDCVFEGYWQTEKYFGEIKELLVSKLRFAYGESRLQEFAKMFSCGCMTSVHIRRGDYLQLNDAYGGICTTQYYREAMNYIRQRESKTRFVFFSDDIEWVQKNLKMEDSLYVNRQMFEDYKDWYDMSLMSMCRHHIIANSSFSWWGAWLSRSAEKIVIAPRKWMNHTEAKCIYPPEWVKL